MLRAYKFRFYPDEKQTVLLVKTLNSCCFLYNSALQERKYAYEAHQRLRCNDQVNELPQMKKIFLEYKVIYSQVLQDVLRRLDKAFDNFFDRVGRIRKGERLKAGYPRFKPAWRYNSFTYPQSGFQILPRGHVNLSKIGTLRVFMHRKVSGTVKTLTVKRDRVADWFVVIVAELAEPKLISKKKKKAVAIDVGIKKLVTLSTGEYIEPPQFFRHSEERLKRMQRELSSKKIGSNNRRKARARLSRAHRKIERQRIDFLHKLSKVLVDKADLLVFENLQIGNMVKNHVLANSIHDASWNKLIQFCSYKASSAGKSIELVDPRGTTQRCSGCGSIVKKSLSERVHRCPNCGLVLNRDFNAALNILDKIGRGTPELTPVEMRPLLLTGASRIREAGSPCL